MHAENLGAIIEILILLIALFKALGWIKDDQWRKTVEAGVAYAEQWKIGQVKAGLPFDNEQVKSIAAGYVLRRFPGANTAALERDIEAAVYLITKMPGEPVAPAVTLIESERERLADWRETKARRQARGTDGKFTKGATS